LIDDIEPAARDDLLLVAAGGFAADGGGLPGAGRLCREARFWASGASGARGFAPAPEALEALLSAEGETTVARAADVVVEGAGLGATEVDTDFDIVGAVVLAPGAREALRFGAAGTAGAELVAPGFAAESAAALGFGSQGIALEGDGGALVGPGALLAFFKVDVADAVGLEGDEGAAAVVFVGGTAFAVPEPKVPELRIWHKTRTKG
jgi:hypothetical protein